MVKQRAKYAAMIAGVAAPIYLVVQLIFGADAGPALVRCLWFFLFVFLVCLAINWESKGDSKQHPASTTPE
jgi:nitrate/nitrite transporter NarK